MISPELLRKAAAKYNKLFKWLKTDQLKIILSFLKRNVLKHMKCSAGFFLRMDMLFIFGKTMLVLVLMNSMKKPEYCRQNKDEGQEARFNIFCFSAFHNRTAIVRINQEQSKEDYPP